jgi:hypothetical protein
VAIEAEGEAKKKGLMRVVAKAIVGEVGEFVRFEIEYSEGLFFVRCIRAVPAVEENGKLIVRREYGGDGEIVNWSRIAGSFGEDAAVGEIYWLLSGNK